MRHTTELQARAPVRKTMGRAVERLLMLLWGGSSKQYYPEAHYMRGPGPKWLEKHGGTDENSGLVRVLNATNEKWSA